MKKMKKMKRVREKAPFGNSRGQFLRQRKEKKCQNEEKTKKQ